MASQPSSLSRERHLLEAALPAFLEMPIAKVTLDLLAERSGLDRYFIHRRFNRERMFRHAILLLVREVAEEAASIDPPAHQSVREAVRGYAVRVAALFASERYRKLLYIVVRDGRENEWLAEAYEGRVTRPIRAKLTGLVRRAGLLSGAALVLRPNSEQRFLAKLENFFVLPALKPDFVEPSADEASAVIEAAVNDIVAATFAVDREVESAAA